MEEETLKYWYYIKSICENSETMNNPYIDPKELQKIERKIINLIRKKKFATLINKKPKK